MTADKELLESLRELQQALSNHSWVIGRLTSRKAAAIATAAIQRIEQDGREVDTVPRVPKQGLVCGDVAVSVDPRYAGWIFVRHVDGENWTTGAKLTPETWGMIAALAEKGAGK